MEEESSNLNEPEIRPRCKWCHKLGHVRRSNKDCGQYIKRSAIQSKPMIDGRTDHPEVQATVKMSLGQLLNVDGEERQIFVGIIDTVVANITKMNYIADHVQSIFVEEMLSTSEKEEKVMSLHNAKGGFLNLFYSLIREHFQGISDSKAVRDEDVVRVVQNCLSLVDPQNMTPGPDTWNDVPMVTGLPLFVQYEVSKRMTAIKNHLAVNVPLRIKYFVKHKLQHLSKNVMNKLADAAIATPLVGEGALEKLDEMEDDDITLVDREYIVSIMQDLQGLLEEKPIDDASIKKKPLGYLKPLVMLRNEAVAAEAIRAQNADYEPENIECPAIVPERNIRPRYGHQRLSKAERSRRRKFRQTQNRKQFKRKMKRKRRKLQYERNKKPKAVEQRKRKEFNFKVFDILPHSTPESKFITIDFKGIYALDRVVRPGGKWEPPENEPDRTALWRRYFKLDKVEKNRRRFGCLLQTDGVSVCVNLRKPKVREEVNENGFRYLKVGDEGYKKPRKVRSKKRKTMVDIPQTEFVRLQIPDGTKVIGIDPGSRDIVTASWGKQKRQSLSYSKKTWNVLNGSNMCKLKRAKWMNRLSIDQRSILLDMVSTKGGLMIQMEALEYRLQHLHFILGYYGHKKFRKLKLFQFSRKRQALDRLCNTIIGNDPENVYIGYGNGTFNSMKNSSSSPTKMIFNALRKRIGNRCRLVDEYATSILCSKDECGNIENPQRMKPNALKLWSLKVCERCNRNWNRDVNASANIRDIFIYMNDADNNGGKPTRFRRRIRN